MKPDRISTGAWDGSPTVLAVYRDGRVLAFSHDGKKWNEANAADVATKSSKLSGDDFAKMFPGLAPPKLPE